jgi:hypothetical protein
VHVASHTVYITFHILHTAMKWEAVHSIVGELKSWNCAFFEAEQHTHTHTTLHYIYIYMCVCVYIYIKQFTFKAVFLKAHLLMQTEQLCVCIHYLINHMIMKAWVKIIDSILLHHK